MAVKICDDDSSLFGGGVDGGASRSMWGYADLEAVACSGEVMIRTGDLLEREPTISRLTLVSVGRTF